MVHFVLILWYYCIIVNVTLSDKISLKLHFGYFEMWIILKNAVPDDCFGIKTNTVVKELLKLWLFEVAKHYGSQFEKTTLKDFLSFCIVSLAASRMLSIMAASLRKQPWKIFVILHIFLSNFQNYSIEINWT